MVQSLASKNIKAVILVLFLFIFVFNLNICLAEKAGNLNNAFGPQSPLDKAAGDKGAGYKTDVSVESMIGLIITTVLTFVGVVFLILAIYGGYLWMMARGNDEQVEKAKKTITNAIIGLVVVLAAYAISWYIVNAIGGKVFK